MFSVGYIRSIYIIRRGTMGQGIEPADVFTKGGRYAI